MELARDPGFSITYDSAEIFRKVLDSMARPGKINRLPANNLTPPKGANRYAISVLLTLLDQEVSFSVSGADSGLYKNIRDYIVTNTGSREKPTPEADYLYATNGRSDGGVLKIKRGNLLYPDRSATIVYEVDDLSSEAKKSSGYILLLLTGPGILGEGKVWVHSPSFKQEREGFSEATKNRPLGVEAILIDKEGKIIALTRYTDMMVTHK